MSTVVFLSAPAHGHVNPTLPLITELVRRGERVYYYALEEFRAAIEHTGATYRNYGEGFPTNRVSDGNTAMGNPFLIIEVTLEASKWVLDRLLPEIQELQPDYIIHDAFCCWGSYVAQILRLPSISSIPTIAFNRKITAGGPRELLGLVGMLWGGRKALRHCRELIKELRDTYHIKTPRILFELIRNYSALNIVYTSRTFQPFADSFDDRYFKFVGPSPDPFAVTTSFPFEKLGTKPLIYISLGTVYNTRLLFFRNCIEAFNDGKYQVVMAIGQKLSKEALGEIPENFIIERYVPQRDVLQRCAVFITHGGANSVNDAFSYHVPMLVVPQSVDQPWNAKRVVELGAGKSLNNKQATASNLRRAIEEILVQPTYKAAAARVGGSLRLAGGSRRAADEIEAFKRQNIMTWIATRH